MRRRTYTPGAIPEVEMRWLGDAIIGDASIASLQVIDALGRVCRNAMIASPMIASPNHRVSTEGMIPGVYVLRLVQGDDVKTQKIVIK